ncbi:MAG: hypothetical protein WKI04_16410 [Ferruginibacter sp.]
MKFFKSVIISFTIWIMTGILNTLLSGSYLYYFSNEFSDAPGTYLLSFIFTLVFSIPGIFIFWLVLLVNRNSKLLFRSLLQAGFLISALSSLLLFALPFNHAKGQLVFLSGCIVVSPIASIMLHHSPIRSSTETKQHNHV